MNRIILGGKKATAKKGQFQPRNGWNSFLQLSLNPTNLRAVNAKAPVNPNCCANPELCPLNQVPPGTAVRIKQLSAPPDMIHRLRELGFCEDALIRLLSQQSNVICMVCNVRLGISLQLAESILVEPVHQPPLTRVA